MRAVHCKDFDNKFPETFSWVKLDNPTLTNICIAMNIIIDNETCRPENQKNNVLGLRKALNIIVDYAHLM